MTDDALPALDEVAALRAENFRLKRELAEQREQTRRILANDRVGYLISSFVHNRFIEANRAFCDFIGRDREELLATDPYQFWLDTTFPDDRDLEHRQLKRVAEGAIDSYRIEKRYVRPDGEVRWAETTFCALRDEGGRLEHAVIACIDIQEQRAALASRDKLQSRLLQSQKLETVGRLVGGVAHDFNNRLLVIMGHADLLKRSSASDPVLAAHADAVLTSARRAADLTGQLLAYSRRQVLRLRAVDVNAVVEGTRQMLARTIGEQLELVTVCGAKFPMLADAGQLEQVLMNLVLNARDAMPSGGRITLETLDVEVTSSNPMEGLAPGQYVALAVRDTGTGVPEAHREHIFEPFFTTKDVGQGTGLGLATVEGIVRQSGGIITLKSDDGRGSVFTVYLPRAAESAEAAPALSEEAARNRYKVCGQGETVLVVDDEEDVRKLLVEALAQGGYRVLEARNGKEALAISETRPSAVDLLVTDGVMPGGSGFELADALLARNGALKVLIMSGYAEHLSRPLHANERFIMKPFLPDELYAEVAEFLGQPGSTQAGDNTAEHP